MSDSIDIDKLIKVLRELDASQLCMGWHQYRDDIEDALLLDRGTLCTGCVTQDVIQIQRELDLPLSVTLRLLRDGEVFIQNGVVIDRRKEDKDND